MTNGFREPAQVIAIGITLRNYDIKCPADSDVEGRQMLLDAPIMAIFGGIASLSYYLLWVQQEPVGTGQLFGAHCFPSKDGSPLPFRIPYTGYENLDIVLCLMVSFFVPATHDTPIWRYTLDLVGSLAVELTPFLLDVSALFRSNRVASVLFPLLLGLVYTFKGGAIVLPSYWLLSLIVLSVQRSAGIVPSLPDTVASQAAAFAVLSGYILPSMVMEISPTPRNIAFWVCFPITIALAQVAYYISATLGLAPILLPPSLGKLSSYEIIQLTYIALGVFSTITHVPLLCGIVFTRNPLAAASNQLIPHMGVYSYAAKEEFWHHGLRNEVKRFLQWDHIMIALTTWLAGSWSWAFSSVALASRILIVSLLGSILLGPGTVVAATFIVREALYQQSREMLAGGSARALPTTTVDMVVGAVQGVLAGESRIIL